MAVLEFRRFKKHDGPKVEEEPKAEEEKEGWLSGTAICLHCKKEWAAVSSPGAETMMMECPECGLGKGVFKYNIHPDTVWECMCGNRTFVVNLSGVICTHCGVLCVSP